MVDSMRKTVTRKGRAYKAVVTPEEYKHQNMLFSALKEEKSMSASALSFVSALLGTSSKEYDEEFITELENMIQKYKEEKEIDY